MEINGGEDNINNKIKTTLGDKTINNPREVIMVILVRGSKDNLIGDNAGRKEIGLKVQECNMWKPRGGMNVPPTGRRVSIVSSREADQVIDVVAGTFTIHSIAVNVLFDSGATCSFLAKNKLEELNLESFEKLSYKASCILAVPSRKLYSCDRLYKDVPLKIGIVDFPSNLCVRHGRFGSGFGNGLVRKVQSFN